MTSRPALKPLLALAFGGTALIVATVFGVLSGGLPRPLVLASIGLTAFTALIGWALAAYIARPLRAWQHAADELRQPDPKPGWPRIDSYREAAQAGAALTALIDSLASERTTLRAVNHALEERVQERTEALDRTQQHLTSLQDAHQQLLSQLESLAHTDSLTGLANRNAFLQRVETEASRASRSGQPFSVILFDLDHFKQINRQYGDAVGDDAIRRLAATCSTLLREIDLMARFGGEEFIVLLPESDLDSARHVAERLRGAITGIRLPVVSGHHALTASFGVTEWEAGMSIRSLLMHADLALSRAKHAGRDRVVAEHAESLADRRHVV